MVRTLSASDFDNLIVFPMALKFSLATCCNQSHFRAGMEASIKLVVDQKFYVYMYIYIYTYSTSFSLHRDLQEP